MGRFADIREAYHRDVFAQLVHVNPKTAVPNMADKTNSVSTALARSLCKTLGYKTAKLNPTAQKRGAKFCDLTMEFIRIAFQQLGHIRPGP